MFSYIIWLNSEWEQLRYVQDCVSWAQGQKVIKYVCRHTKLAVDLKLIFSRISLLLFFKQSYIGFNWNRAGYLFLKSETKFQTPCQKALIWDPAMVSMIKTQLTIRQNVNKVKIQISLLFFQLQIGFTCISCSRRLEISHRPCKLFQEGHFLHIVII